MVMKAISVAATLLVPNATEVQADVRTDFEVCADAALQEVLPPNYETGTSINYEGSFAVPQENDAMSWDNTYEVKPPKDLRSGFISSYNDDGGLNGSSVTIDGNGSIIGEIEGNGYGAEEIKAISEHIQDCMGLSLTS